MIRIHAKQIAGEIEAIPSKSYAHRALICAALAEGPSSILLDRSSIDIDATAQALVGLGAQVKRVETGFSILPADMIPDDPEVDCVESGSTLRFLMPVAAAMTDNVRFTGQGRLPERPLSPLLEEMEKKGCKFSQNTLPFRITGRLEGGRFTLPGNVSSQYITGLLLAAPRLGEVEIIITSPLESEDYVEITRDVMRDFGVEVLRTPGGYRVPGGQYYRGCRYEVEGDWSNAAFFLVGGALSAGIRMTGLLSDSIQGDRGILKVLRDYGAVVESHHGIQVGPGAARPIQVDLKQMPDALPILAVLAASARGESVFFGGERLRLKESDRLQTSALMIRNLGGHAEETADGLVVSGNGRLKGGVTSSFGDHRLAMASAIASVLCEEPVHIEDAHAVNKSYPDFYRDFQRIGGMYV